MPFKIVQIIEGEELSLCIVPSPWERNGILYWPKKSQVAELVQDESSRPGLTWEQLQCIKKDICLTKEQAQKKLKDMENQSYRTDANVSNTQRPVEFLDNCSNNVQLKRQTRQQQSTSSCDSLEEIDNTLGANAPTTSISNDFDDNDSLHNDKNVTHTILAQVLENQQRMLNQLNKLQSSFNNFVNQHPDKAETQIVSIHNHQLINESERHSPNVNVPLQPVISVNELNMLEENLKNEEYMKKVIENMTFICGSNGKASGLDCCYKLIDYVIDRYFLVRCSWTGNCRGEDGATKVPLKFYEQFRKCFFCIIKQADKNFTITECDMFFKRILKNSKQRTIAKRNIVSAHKSRPSNLKYNKEKRQRTSSPEYDKDLIEEESTEPTLKCETED